ncbi:hypothetical protein Pmar_PMAR000669 [Perkinsus marinus ATCC 50983]|uniref:Uncharacterized protein n=1 Tax=Perkinsus marinus (strain ATCC 50983 / TXsc) TaxID=423536 RepID=C5KRG0_PERM5|nr:hypothetical protein Pmar_PMAR000669 [Perkinsus marinus ATCC 50983]EER12933.1 hypothetical protein Pmar_PMAR000669 [Perkinsus marinus ATCC 50983]|eukprot:XP_002781138.1 hypothetical protein Pmar_PMAR000669 [Perkinsus marinus ATCC 50983]
MLEVPIDLVIVMGHIIECLSGRRVRVRLVNGLVTTENLYNIVMLYPYAGNELGTAVVSREGMYIDVKNDSEWRAARVTYDPCDRPDKLWIWFLDGNNDTPIMVRLDSIEWRLSSDTCGTPQGGRDGAAIGQRISVAYIVLRKRQWFSGVIVRSRSPNIVTIAFDNGYVDEIDLSTTGYKLNTRS